MRCLLFDFPYFVAKSCLEIKKYVRKNVTAVMLSPFCCEEQMSQKLFAIARTVFEIDEQPVYFVSYSNRLF